jgi:flagellar hook assembly protein FlgD
MTPSPSITITSTVGISPVISPTVTRTALVLPEATATPTSTATDTATATGTVTPVAMGEIVIYPNPFKPSAAVGHVLKIDNLPLHAQIKLYTVSGELIRKFVSQAPRQTWDGTNEQGSRVVPGIYIYVITCDHSEKIMGQLLVVK